MVTDQPLGIKGIGSRRDLLPRSQPLIRAKREVSMRKHLRILRAAAAVSAIASVAYATSPSFHFANAFFDLNNPDQLDVSFKETGLGNTGFSSVDITVTADATVTCQFVNSGGNCPKTTHKPTNNALVSGLGSFPRRKRQTTRAISGSPPSWL